MAGVVEGAEKPYEYTEEKVPGLTKVLIFYILAFDSLFYILECNQYIKALSPTKALKTVIIGLFIIFAVWGLITIISLAKTFSKAIIIAKIYVLARSVLFLAGDIMFLFYKYNNPDSIGKLENQFKTKADLIQTLLVVPLIYIIPLTAVCFVYLAKSKKLKKACLKSKL